MRYFTKFCLTILIMVVVAIGMGQESCPTGIGYWVNQDEATLTGSSQPIPSAVTHLVAEDFRPALVILCWQDNSNNEESIRIERKTWLGEYIEIASVGADIIRYGDRDISPTVMYCYRVRAYNKDGYSMYSNEAISGYPPIPPMPYNLCATATTNSQIDLAWKEDYSGWLDFPIQSRVGTDTNWSQIEILTVECDPTMTIAFCDDVVITTTATYFYRVSACNETGQSDWSDEVWITMPVE